MQFEEAAKRVSQQLVTAKEDGSEPDVKEVQVGGQIYHTARFSGSNGCDRTINTVKADTVSSFYLVLAEIG